MTQTIASLQDKSPGELNVICAELCGFEVLPAVGIRKAMVRTRLEANQRSTDWMVIPPYATSYDAIMPEVKNLQGWKRHDFLRIVGNLAGCEEDSYAHEFNRLTASPADLTRALILTKQTNEEAK